MQSHNLKLTVEKLNKDMSFVQKGSDMFNIEASIKIVQGEIAAL